MKKKIGLMEVKQALRDGRFRDKLPLELRDDVAKFLQNPGCPCNKPTFKKVLKVAGQQLLEYYGTEAEIDITADDVDLGIATLPPPPNFEPTFTAPPELEEFEFECTVINCNINELAKKLAELPKHSPKQISIARYEDQITCIVNELPQRGRKMISQSSNQNSLIN